MGLTFTNLEKVSKSDITSAFNQIYSDYPLPLHMEEDALFNRLNNMNVDFSSSFACFDDNKLVALAFFGVRANSSYIAGCGTIPSYRRKGITKKLFNLSFSSLKEKGVKTVNLECLENNTKALSFYSSLGFKNVGLLYCYEIKELEPKAESIRFTTSLSPLEIEKEATHKPTWQNCYESYKNSKHKVISYNNSSLVYSPSGSIFVAKGKKEEILPLIEEVYKETGVVYLVNVNEKDSVLNSTLSELNIKPYAKQILLRRDL